MPADESPPQPRRVRTQTLSGSAAPAEDEPLLVSADRDPADRWLDRLLARRGLLDEAAPLLGDGERVPRVGVLLALPAIGQSSVIDTAREVYGSIGPAFYGLRTTIVALVFLALRRIKRPRGDQGARVARPMLASAGDIAVTATELYVTPTPLIARGADPDVSRSRHRSPSEHNCPRM